MSALPKLSAPYSPAVFPALVEKQLSEADNTDSDEAVSPETEAGERDISQDWVVGVIPRCPGVG